MFRHLLPLLLLSLLQQITSAAERVALVIGNQDYTETGRFSDLGTTRHDAREVARLLRDEADFDRVQTLLDKTRREMEQDLASFAQTILPGDEVVFYFAGHGVEYDNKLYLMGIDAEFLLKAKLDQEGMSEPVVSATLAGTGAKISVLLLDCCRQVPDQTWLASERATRGLRGEQAAAPKPPPNVLVGYATSAGRLANDNLAVTDQNGPLVSSLKRHWSSGLEFDALWKQVARDVFADSTKAAVSAGNSEIEIQMPSKYGQTIHDFYFVKSSHGPNPLIAQTSKVMESDPSVPATRPHSGIGNTSSSLLPTLPARGYFTQSELLSGSRYATYNSYSKGLILKAAQVNLKAHGHYIGGADGLAGPGTQKSILNFQQSRGLPVTGILDAPTLQALGIHDMSEVSPPTIIADPPGTPPGEMFKPRAKNVLIPVGGGSYRSPHAPNEKPFSRPGLESGWEIACPYTGKPCRVP